jgi:hypothetical protein
MRASRSFPNAAVVTSAMAFRSEGVSARYKLRFRVTTQGEVTVRSGILAFGTALVVGLILTTVAAARPGSRSTGVGSVFVSNPVQSLGDESLTDQKDSDAAVPAAAYYNVQLMHLDGSGYLRGDYADVYSSTSTAWTTRSRPIIRRTSCASARAASTTRRMRR